MRTYMRRLVIKWVWILAYRKDAKVKTTQRIFKETIEFNDTYCYPITIGAMQILIKKLSDELQKVDFNRMDEVDDYSVNKLLCAIEDLTKIINDAMWDYSQGIEYEYRVFDSF